MLLLAVLMCDQLIEGSVVLAIYALLLRLVIYTHTHLLIRFQYHHHPCTPVCRPFHFSNNPFSFHSLKLILNSIKSRGTYFGVIQVCGTASLLSCISYFPVKHPRPKNSQGNLKTNCFFICINSIDLCNKV